MHTFERDNLHGEAVIRIREVKEENNEKRQKETRKEDRRRAA